MPVTQSIHPPQNLVVLYYHGLITLNEVLDNISIVTQNPEFTNQQRILIVFSDNADLRGISADNIHRIKRSAPVIQNKTTHVCVTNDDLTFGLCRMLAAESDGGELHVVRTLEEACQLLKIELSFFAKHQICTSAR